MLHFLFVLCLTRSEHDLELLAPQLMQIFVPGHLVCLTIELYLLPPKARHAYWNTFQPIRTGLTPVHAAMPGLRNGRFLTQIQFGTL
jgi:hypothetical protein